MCQFTAKVALVLLSTAFWVVAVCLFIIGSIVFAEYKHYDQINDAWFTLIPAIVLLGVGILLVLIGVVGCVGAVKEQRCLLGLFSTILLIIFAGLLVSAILAYIYKKSVSDQIETGMDKVLKRYGLNDSEPFTNQMDYIQQKLQCCGVHNYTDWLDTPWYKNQLYVPKHNYPDSCCPTNTNSSNTYCLSDKVFNKGCFDLVTNVFNNHLMISAIAALIILIILVLGVVFACVLMCKQRNSTPYSILSNEGMRV